MADDETAPVGALTISLSCLVNFNPPVTVNVVSSAYCGGLLHMPTYGNQFMNSLLHSLEQVPTATTALAVVALIGGIVIGFLGASLF
jgi:hypothetical protein